MFEQNSAEIAQAGFGESSDEFRSSLAAIRRAGVVVTRGEIDPGRVGIGAPLFDRDRNILGSLSFALMAGRADNALIGRLTPLLIAGAREIERLMNEEPASQPSSARLRVAR
jgi:DNA-binding IclR family transcriptional regulator